MDELLSAPWAAEFSTCLGRDFVKKTIADTLADMRRELTANAPTISGTKAELADLAAARVIARLRAQSVSSLKRVINASGVIVHTNLGRSPLAPNALKAVSEIVGAYSTLEYSPESGGRGGRNSHVEWLICEITGADAALVVNNNAAAVLLALSATAAGREVIVSNGELVEIGDSFRIPDILSFSGASMIAVGCTNSTRIADYRNAITEKTAALLKVHPSNYRIEGFTASARREELGELAASRGLAFIEDLGSGLLSPLAVPFAASEHSVRNCLQAAGGASYVVTFSGDKLLGGPQIGVIAGSRQLVDAMRRHQLLRALRVDKMTLAAFEATLRMYLAGRQGEIPVIKMIQASEETLLKKARKLCAELRQIAARQGTADFHIELVQTDDCIGGGAFPTDKLCGCGVALRSSSLGAEHFAAAFRAESVPVIASVRYGCVVLNVRTLLDGDEKEIAASFSRIISALSPNKKGS